LNKINNIQFEEFYSSLKKDELAIVNSLKTILESYPSLKLKISYSVLYFFQRSRVCFIWPASIKSGPKSGVQLGFCNGYLLEDKLKLLEKGNRKQVYCITFKSASEVNREVLEYYIQNAIDVDNQIFSKKKV